MQWKAALFNNHVNDLKAEAALCWSLSSNWKSQLLALLSMYDEAMHANQFSNTLQCQNHSYNATRAISFEGGGLSPRLPDVGLGASESEGSPSKNTSSNFQKMNSFGDAICLVYRPCSTGSSSSQLLQQIRLKLSYSYEPSSTLMSCT